MKQFFKQVLATMVGIIALGLITMFLIYLIALPFMLLSKSETKLDSHSVYQIKLEGVIEERTSADDFTAIVSQFVGKNAQATIGLDDLLANIKLAKEDKHIDGIYLKGGSIIADFATMQELRNALVDFKTSGKFIIAYADTYAQNNYYLVSVADKIYINPQGILSWGGLSGAKMYYKDLFEKLGVEMQVVKVGTFKSAVEPYICSEMSEADKLQTERYMNEIWDVMVNDVAESRSILVRELNNYADELMDLQPQEKYVEYGLVDSLVYAADMKDILEQWVGDDDFEIVSHSEMNNVERSKKYQKNKIAIIYAQGEITDDTGTGIVGKDLVKTINKVAKEDKIKAVVFRVNSPGGSAYASEQICHAITMLKQQKPVVVSMGDYAASGGYYISSNADYIIAQPNTITGSIGIFGMIPCLAGTFNKIGINIATVETNKFSSFNNNMIFKGMNAEERELMQANVNRGYDLFTQRCAEGRHMPQDSIKAIAEGRVWTGTAAIGLGLVDELGGIDQAIAKAAELAGLENYAITDYPDKEDEITALINQLIGEDDFEESILIREMKRIEALTKQPTIQARLPYYMEIK